MPFALLAAPSGTGLESSKTKIIQSLGGEAKVEWVDLEKELCRLPGVADAVQLAEASVYGTHGSGPVTMGRVTLMPRQQVTALWAFAAKEAIGKLKDSTKEHRLLVVNLTYYNAWRREFYFPFRYLDAFRGFRPSQVILLFDDIYDTFMRLAGFGAETADVFDAKRGIATLGFQRSGKVDFTKEWNRFKVVLEWAVQLCSLILEWRKQETLFAENLALQWNASFLPLAIKQPATVLARWLTDPNALSVYLSHNITSFRNEHEDGEVWTDAVLEINRIPTEGDDNLVILMPTGIDELRIKQDNGLLSAGLMDRWPLMPDVLYEPPSQAAPNYADFFRLPTPRSKEPLNWAEEGSRWNRYSGQVEEPKFVDGLLQALLSRIEEQIPLRDQLLVAYSDSLCVYRPSYKGAGVSGGVEAEIKHWIVKSAQSTGEAVTLAFVHSLDDVRALLKSRTIQREARQLQTRTNVRPRGPLQGRPPKLAISRAQQQKFLMPKIEPYVPEQHARVASWAFESEELKSPALPSEVRKTLSARHGQPVRNWLSRAQSLFEEALNA
jgi:hypothetical protein